MACYVDEASDAETYDPRVSVAETSARNAGVIDDDQGILKDMRRISIVVPNMEPTIACEVCVRGGRNFEFLSLRALAAHLEQQHAKVEVGWTCAKCDKAFAKIHAAQCHIPKCHKEPPAKKPHACGECAESFSTKSGLSTHERHKHPDLRNTKRREAAERPPKKQGRALSVWTREETDLLVNLCEQYKDERHINIKIGEHLPNKTRKQISDKRCQLGKTNIERPQELEVQGDEESEEYQALPQQISQEMGIEIIDISDDEDTTPSARKEAHDLNTPWRVALIKNIRTRIAQAGKFQEIDEALSNMADKDNITTEAIDEAIKKFVQLLLPEDKGEMNDAKDNRKNPGSKSKQGKTRNHGKNKKANHNARSRFNYAKCQELYNKCPRKLIDMAMSDTTDHIQRCEAPTAAEI